MDYDRLAVYLLESFEPGKCEPGAVRNLAATLRTQVTKQRLDVPNLPSAGESVAITDSRLKTAALAFDRVLSPPTLEGGAPPNIAVYGATALEIWVQAVLTIAAKLPKQQYVQPTGTPLEVLLGHAQPPIRTLANVLCQERGIVGVPLYSKSADYSRDFAPGRDEVIVAILETIAVPDEARLSWPQVEEFRKDSESRKAYVRFRHWVESAMVGKSLAYIADDVAVRLQSYEAALRKHGVNTVTGTIEAVIDPRFLTAASALLAGVTFAADFAAACATAVAATVAKAACHIVTSRVDLQTTKRGPLSEVAYVHEIQQLTSKKRL